VVPSSSPGRVRILLRAALPGVLVAGLLVLVDRPGAAAVVVVLATSIAVASAVSERFHARFQRILHAVARGVALALGVVLLGLVELVVLAPLSFALWLFRRDPLHVGPPASSRSWGPPSTDTVPQRPYTLEPAPTAPVGARRVLRLVPRVVGWIVIVVVADLVLGSLLNLGTGTDAGVVAMTDEMAAATSDTPWFDDYLAELRQVGQDFAPYVQTVERDATGRYINQRDGVRRSYDAVGEDGTDRPVVQLFGGTNAWGEGQRDEHTIASELARLAEADGHPVRVVNLAQRGDVNFSAVLRFERALAAASGPPDLVVFVDGPDDYQVQRQSPSGDPGQYGLVAAQQAVVREPERSLWRRYADASLLHRAVERVRALVSFQAAWADTPDVAENTASVYERGRRLTVDLAADHTVPVRFFWLPIEGAERPGSVYGEVTERLDPSVTYLGDAFDDLEEPVYLDGVQVNERGAHLLAAAMYRSLRPQIVALEGATP
jgi:hypothetical protein